MRHTDLEAASDAFCIGPLTFEKSSSPRKMPAKMYWPRKLNSRLGVRYQSRTNRTNSTRVWNSQAVAGPTTMAGSLQDSAWETMLAAPGEAGVQGALGAALRTAGGSASAVGGRP